MDDDISLITDQTATLYSLLLHINTIFNTLSTAFLIFLILKYSPESMSVYKWYLLNMTIWCYALDFFNTVLYVPYTIFPAVGTCNLGLLGSLTGFLPRVLANSVSWAMFNQLLGMCGVSIMASSVYRLAALHNATDAMTSPKTIFITVLAHIFYTAPCIAVYVTTFHSDEEQLEYIKNTHPKLLPFWNTHTCSIFISLSHLMRYALVAIAQIVLAAAATLTIVWYCFREMKRTKDVISSKTYRLHKMLTISLLLQFMIPMLLLILPFIAFGIFSVTQLKHAQMVSIVTFVISTTHTTVNAIIMIGMIQPYRKVFFKYFWPIRRMIEATSTAPNSIKVSNQPKSYSFVSSTAVRSQSVRSQVRSQSVVGNM
ncbi:serpentine type 7TM GPCR chemoreceptor srh domain-containing protein [Ditylenchus destructor]|uniref:Serpentine type 7TM GPCR chemoreceptor srh domain-containing protein n=1 Tax=Ditylenchus destructor TaxID=166010 RepID=A0AAD4QYA4_9BILA|nr:serpentine type 7TM GPCR chemoreceptor srh domain-containing protein [Ditylenchus destructor]